ncbi:hypothetical protein RIF29_22972 [Crotalaria pallida]|uniref:Secreted protein n=1 Tax=Crotalaria pallida TaxID=3830 RepID=A0AAN9F543_CROPI
MIYCCNIVTLGLFVLLNGSCPLPMSVLGNDRVRYQHEHVLEVNRHFPFKLIHTFLPPLHFHSYLSLSQEKLMCGKLRQFLKRYSH